MSVVVSAQDVTPPSTEIQPEMTLTETPSPTPSETATLTPAPTETPYAPPITSETPLPIPSPTLPELPAPVVATVEPPPLETVTPTMTALVVPIGTATTAPESSFILGYYDDFESGELNAWLAGAGWLFVPNEIGQVFQVTGSDAPLTLNIGDFYQDFVMDVRVALDSGASKINLRQSEAGAYSVILDANGQIMLYRNDTLLGTGTTAVPIAGAWHDVRVSAIGTSLQVLIDGTAVIVVEDNPPLPAGTISFATIGGGTLRIDNFVTWLYGQNPTPEIEPEMIQAQAVQYNYATTVEQQIGVVNASSALGTVNGSIAQLSDGDCLIVGFSGTVTNGAISLYLGNVQGGVTDRRQIRISVSDQLLPCNSASWQQTAFIDNNSWAGNPFVWRSAGSFTGSRRYVQILTYKNMQLDSIRIYGDFNTPPTVPINCGTVDVSTAAKLRSNANIPSGDTNVIGLIRVTVPWKRFTPIRQTQVGSYTWYLIDYNSYGATPFSYAGVIYDGTRGWLRNDVVNIDECTANGAEIPIGPDQVIDVKLQRNGQPLTIASGASANIPNPAEMWSPLGQCPPGDTTGWSSDINLIRERCAYENYIRLWHDLSGGHQLNDIVTGLLLTSPPGPLSKYWRRGEKRILKSPLHAMGRGFRGGVNA